MGGVSLTINARIARMTLSTNARIAILISTMVNAVIFGIGAVTVLSVPALNANARYLLPAVIAASFLISPFVSRALAPRLRSRFWQEKQDGTHLVS
jgi:hypothetical protein